MTQETELAFDIINNKLQSAKKSPVILSWDDAETIKAALSQSRARVGKGDAIAEALVKAIECLHTAPIDIETHSFDPIATAESNIRYAISLLSTQAKPVEAGELAEVITIALPKTPSDKSIGLHVEQAILAKYNVTEKL